MMVQKSKTKIIKYKTPPAILSRGSYTDYGGTIESEVYRIVVYKYYSLCMSVTPEELKQEIAIAVWRAKKRVSKKEDHYKARLYKYVILTIRNWLLKLKAKAIVRSAEVPVEVGTEVDRYEWDDFVTGLTQGEQEVYRAYIAGYSQVEIAEMFGVSKQYVGQTIRRIVVAGKKYFGIK